jgi:hypothetical protein
MSIATLKKKTGHLYNSQSVGYTNFSLNGTKRSQGYIGQTSLSRSLPRTLARGNTHRGYGGNNGVFKDVSVGITSGLVDFNDSNTIKSSVSSNKGMLENRFMWVRRPYPFSSTKPNSHLNTNTQSDHIEGKKKCIVATTNTGISPTTPVKTCNTLAKKYMTASYKHINTINNQCTSSMTAPQQGDVINSEGVYISHLAGSCSNLDKLYNLRFPSSIQRSPIP